MIVVNIFNVLLYFFGAITILSTRSVLAGADYRSRSHSRHRYQYSSLLSQRQQPPRDPNPPPTIEDLEEQAATSNDAIDIVLDQVVGVNGGVIIDRYIPSRIWLWRQWYSTVFYNSIRNTCWKMLASFGLCCLLRRMIHGDWKVWQHPAAISDQQTKNIAATQVLDSFYKIWKSLLPLTTLVLTFFVTQAYNFWVSVYLLCFTTPI